MHKFGRETGPHINLEEESGHNRDKSTLHNLVDNLEALGFHQETTEDPIEQTETTEDSTEIPGLVLYQTLFYLLEKNYYKFQLQYKIQNTSCYSNVSGNIIK